MALRKLVLIAPVVFILHVLEEAPAFVAWFNSLVPRGITQSLLLTVNAVALTITLFLAVVVATSSDAASGLLLAAWVGFLMLANGLFHLVGTIVHGRYCPGVVTGALLYLPFGVLLLRRIIRDLKLQPLLVVAAAAVGAVPMLVHGYLIVFRASRLF
ncbi:MAG: HXXEE domain-containing protein [Thermoanaerobaculia bacterium]